ncbi:MAG: hypothetical protein ACRCS9_07245, partial [Hyphomicrobium sp.]
MPLEYVFAAGAAGTTVLALMARHDRLVAREKRRRIFADVLDRFDDGQISFDGSGLAELKGRAGGLDLHLTLIPDTMTIRRLPQLWLSVTALRPMSIAGAGVAILVRPSGADFYSLTERMDVRFDPPPALPWEVLVRGESNAAKTTLDAITPVAARLLADPKIKEVAVTSRGARLIWQLAEGRRGQHLLLRQADFGDAVLELADLDRLMQGV